MVNGAYVEDITKYIAWNNLGYSSVSY